MLVEMLRRLPDDEVDEAGVRKHLDISIIDCDPRMPATCTVGKRRSSS